MQRKIITANKLNAILKQNEFDKSNFQIYKRVFNATNGNSYFN